MGSREKGEEEEERRGRNGSYLVVMVHFSFKGGPLIPSFLPWEGKEECRIYAPRISLPLARMMHTGVEFSTGSKVQCMFCFEIFTLEGRGGEKGGNENFKSKHTEPFPFTQVSVHYNVYFAVILPFARQPCPRGDLLRSLLSLRRRRPPPSPRSISPFPLIRARAAWMDLAKGIAPSQGVVQG